MIGWWILGAVVFAVVVIWACSIEDKYDPPKYTRADKPCVGTLHPSGKHTYCDGVCIFCDAKEKDFKKYVN